MSTSENMPPESIHDGDSILQSNLLSADRQSLDHFIGGDPSHADHMEEVDPSNGSKKIKKVRLQLDIRTELTDEELKVSSVVNPSCHVIEYFLQAAREKYTEEQRIIRLELEKKILESLTKDLGATALFSGAFAAMVGADAPLAEAGSHLLRGVGEPVEVFALKEERPSSD